MTPSRLRFYLMNLEFMGAKPLEIEPGHQTLGLLPIVLRDTALVLRKATNYEQTLTQLKQNKGYAITCTAEFDVDSENDVASKIEISNTVSALLTLAAGTRISCPYFQLFTATGELIKTAHSPVISRSYSPLPLIDPREKDDLGLFLETSYSQYQTLKATYDMHKVVNFYTEARRGEVFLEGRGLILSALIDYLTQRYGGKKVRFCDRMKRFRSEYKTNVFDEYITVFVNSRNLLAHTLGFSGSDYVAECMAMVHFVDRMLLSMLGYEGYYINWTNRIREKNSLLQTN
jgi:hypothetical protein